MPRIINKRRNARPTLCARCGTDDYEPSYRTPYCVVCRRDLNREATRQRMQELRARRRAQAETAADGDTLINMHFALDRDQRHELLTRILSEDPELIARVLTGSV